MTVDEFDTWLAEYCTAYPDTAAWMNASGDPGAVASLWAEALDDVDLQDARAVIKRMMRGDDDYVQAYDRDKTAAIVRRHAIEARRRRLVSERAPTPPEWMTAGQRANFDCGSALRNILDGLEAGMNESEALQAYLPPINPEDEPRYRCATCLDRGLITVWSVRAMKAAAAGDVPAKDQTTVQVRCRCEAGEKYQGLQAGIKSGGGSVVGAICVFDERKWLKPHGLGRAQRSTNLIEWMRGFRERQHVEYDQLDLPDYSRSDASYGF